ncbi:MAG TPA: hypothetical protein VFO62_10685 [Candidatus Binatia bacterium]|nr:hypothetical protein [Candidatus Binatia bacterium]
MTKWALTKGVLEVDGRLNVDGTMVIWGRMSTAHGEGRDWHRDAASALARAVEMRRDRLASLRQQIAKLERMVSFEIVKVES